MLTKTKIIEVITAHIFAPVTEEAKQHTKLKIASDLCISPDKVLLGEHVISVIDGDEVHRLIVSEAGIVTIVESDIQVAEKVMNDLFQRDPAAIWLLCNNRVLTSEAMACSGAVVPQAMDMATGVAYTMGAIDLLNGVLSVMTGKRLDFKWDTTNADKGEIHFDGFMVKSEAVKTVASDPAKVAGENT